MASSKCSVDNCKRNSDTFCDHCQEQVCTKHFIEHVKLANVELTFLSDELNELVNSIRQDDLNRNALEQIEQWREESHRRIEELYDEKRQEIKIQINEKFLQQMKVLRDFGAKIKELINEGDASFKEIQDIKNSLKDYRKQCEQLTIDTSFQLNTKAIHIEIVRFNRDFFRGNGTLLSIEHQMKLNEFYDKKEQIWTLIYKATRDGFSHLDFHRCCDNQGPTITVIQTIDNGYLFGGYTSVSWHSTQSYANDLNCPFLFTLINPHGIPPTKYPIKLPAYSTYNNIRYCATFGGGHDIYVSSNSNEQKQSSIYFPHTYTDTTNRGSLTFTGGKKFQTKDIEVYRLAAQP
ncbi:hypothetical protein I4U23_009170 [Adineta vaga]|nr:hypothetical protein I4U23_009170 [Adineta vaga]